MFGLGERKGGKSKNRMRATNGEYRSGGIGLERVVKEMGCKMVRRITVGWHAHYSDGSVD